MYQKKANSEGSEKWIAKLLLNCFYGTFGRRNETTSTHIVESKNLSYYLSHYVVNSILQINGDTFTVIVKNNVNSKILTELNSYISSDF